MRREWTGVCAALILMSSVCLAGEIGFEEDFALAVDRAEVLKQLIPGTEEYYYYHCIHLQNTGEFGKVGEMLKLWIDRHGRTARVIEIENRQALLTYDGNHAETLKYLQQKLSLRFDHERERLDQRPQLGTVLDANLIGRDVLTKNALARHARTTDGFEDSALDWLIRQQLDADRRRHLLSRLKRPDIENLPRLVVDDLAHQYSRGFGSLEIHKALLLVQLDECLKLKPDLLNETNFVNVYLPRLHPNADVDWRHDPVERAAYDKRLWDFVSKLTPSHNSLKAHVLYHRLEHQRALGVWDKDLFMEYLKLPRSMSYVERKYLERPEFRGVAANLNSNYQPQTLLPPVRNDEALVRSYLMHFFLTEDSAKPYETYINDVYLKHVFAETKIVNGLGDMETWYSMLPPVMYQELKERVDLDFAHTNRERFAPDAPVTLDLLVKNVDKLIVKVFEINAMNFYQENGREVNTDVNLDGLVANEEKVHTYTEPPLRRMARRFTFPTLTRRGVYVVEFIGGGKSSRALIRKGKLRFLVRTSTAGHVFTVLDETGNKLPEATLWLSGREYAPDKDGTLTVPFTAKPGKQSIILKHGNFATLAEFGHESEDYELDAGIYVDRETLLKRQTATVVVRPALYVNKTPVTLSVLEEVTLTIASVDGEGVRTTKKVPDFKLFEDRESTYEFQVPEDLRQIAFSLTAKVQNLSRNEKVDLSADASFALNGIDGSDKVEDLHLRHVAGRHSLDVLGKTGEVKPDRPVALTFKHRDFKDTVHVTLQTDVKGVVSLGELKEIEWVQARGPEGTDHKWLLPDDVHSMPQAIHAARGEAIHVPYMGTEKAVTASEFSLLEVRGGTFVADRIKALSLRDGFLVLTGLEPGDYDLLIKSSGEHVTVRVTAALRRGDGTHVLGENRVLEVTNPAPLQIVAVEADANNVRVRLKNATKFARVHVVATRFMPEYAIAAALGKIRFPGVSFEHVEGPESLYIAGRNIGDEYRYILERKYAKKYPGNLLKRPELLLNPWAIRKTETARQVAAEGEAFGARGRGAARAEGKSWGGYVRGLQKGTGPVSANLDFLAEQAVVLTNLRPNAAGIVTIPRKDLGAHQQIHVVAVDPQNTVFREVSLPEVPAQFLDLRLAKGLDPQKHFTEQKQITALKAAERFVVEDRTTSKVETYDTLAKVYALYVTLSGDANLREFAFILEWPKMKDEQKQEKYSKYACHELNFFLSRKDPAFFEKVVQPYLRNKKDKTFLDECLVGADLSGYLTPWRHARLNVVERILLAQRIRGEQAATARHVGDLFDLLPPDIERFNHLFKTALKGRALEVAEGAGVMLPFAPAEAAPPLADRDALRSALATAAPRPAAPSRALARKDAEEAKKAVAGEALKQLGVVEQADGYFAEDKARRRTVRQLYRKLDKTKEWVENNYYHLPIEAQDADLVKVNAFWRDYAAHAQGPFFSTRLAEATHSFTEMMFALAVLELPFEAKEHKSEVKDAQVTLTPGSPLVVFHKEIKEAQAAQRTSILVSQNFFRHGDRYRYEQGEKLDKFVTDEFLVHVVYGCQVVITNPTSSPQKLDVLLQVPRGAMPVQNGFYTRGIHLDLQPYHTTTVEYYFYFPFAGKHLHYPVHVAKNEQLIGFAAPVTLNAVEKLSKMDVTSWDYISQHGTADEVLDFVKRENINRVKLDRIAWRMKDKTYFANVIGLLSARHVYDHTLWSYGIRHDAPAAVREYLQHCDDVVNGCGPYINTTLLTIDPVLRKSYQHMEYSPLVNARAHQLGKRRNIVNDRFFDQYERLMTVLRYRPKLDDDDLMAVTYYLLLQDRVEEGMTFFRQVNAAKLQTQIQYDYMRAYLDFYTDTPRLVRGIVTGKNYHRHPVDRWRKAFEAMLAQMDEIEGRAARVVDDKDRAQIQARLAATEPGFDFKVENRQITVDYQNVKQVHVNYYLMDIELLFSRNPFVQEYSGQFAYIRPNASAVVTLPAGVAKHTFALPAQFHASNVMVEIEAGGVKKSRAYFSHALALQVIENYGQLTVTHEATRRALAKVYVKVYARTKDGRIEFYKDGYTDLRGRFDYTSLNTNELDNVERFSILVMSETHGAVVREAAPPKR